MTVVRYETFWTSRADGWAIAARGYARAMESAGLDVRLYSWAPYPPILDERVLEEVGPLFGKRANKNHDIYVFCTALGKPEKIDPILRQLARGPGKKVFYTTLERVNVESSTADLLRALDGVWVPCEANARVMREAGVPAKALSHVYFDDHPNLKIAPSSKVDTYYWIGRWEPRKAPDNLIRAFMQTFAPGEARLVLKLSPTGPTRWTSLPHSPEEALLKSCKGTGWKPSDIREHVEVIREGLTEEQMAELHARCDVYVSASRGEGWDLPSFEAKLAQRRVITTDSGGPASFVTPNDILVPARGRVPAPDYFDLWGEGAQYLDYDVALLAEALKRAKEQPLPGQLPDKSFRAELVGPRIKEWLEGL